VSEFGQTSVIGLIGGLALLAAVPLQAEDVFVQIDPKVRVPYKPLGIAGSGYKVKSVGENRWEVKSVTGSNHYHWLTDKIAVRRASELAISVNKPFVLVSVKKATRNITGYLSTAMLIIEVTAVDTADETSHCSEKISTFTCKTFTAEIAMTETLPYLKLPTEK
jgi:hypothetical protein